MTLSYAFLPDTRAPVPPRLPNGGLYTGQPAHGDWGNVPVVPEAHVLTTQNLLSAGPPPGAIHQSVSLMRPGNNHVEHPYHASVANLNGLYINTSR
jgi:hypothetical protein